MIPKTGEKTVLCPESRWKGTSENWEWFSPGFMVLTDKQARPHGPGIYPLAAPMTWVETHPAP